jgi:membrane-associated phospholipid phosphatase
VDRIDRAGVETISGLDWPVFTPAMKWISDLHTVVFLVLAVAVSISLRRLAPIVMVALTAIIAGQVGGLLKDAFDRPRPPIGDHHVHALIALPASSSMPSGHALTSFACAVVLGGFVPRMRVPLLVFASVVAFSRVYLGVHYPSDVLVGAAVGVALGLGINFAMSSVESFANRTSETG